MENLYRGTLRGPLRTKANSSVDQWAGVTVLGSGSATVTVSVTTVKSDSIILPIMQSLTNQASGFGAPVEVRTIVDGSHFIMGYADGNARARDANVHWMVINTKE